MNDRKNYLVPVDQWNEYMKSKSKPGEFNDDEEEKMKENDNRIVDKPRPEKDMSLLEAAGESDSSDEEEDLLLPTTQPQKPPTPYPYKKKNNNNNNKKMNSSVKNQLNQHEKQEEKEEARPQRVLHYDFPCLGDIKSKSKMPNKRKISWIKI